MALEKIDILYFIEHKDRELTIAKIISKQLYDEYGLKVIILSQVFDATISAFKFCPKVLVTPSTSFGVGSPGWIFYQIYGKQICYINLNFEQFLGTWESKSKLIFNQITKEYQNHFAWGKEFADILEDNGVNRNNIHITGRPLNCLVRNEYSRDRERHKREISNYHSIANSPKFFLFALTDGIAFCKSKTIKSIAKRGFSEKKIFEIQKYIKQSISILIKWIAEASKLIPKDNYLVLRPHPMVSNEEYLSLFKDIVGELPVNIIVTKSFDAQKWISASEMYFTNYSTLLLDADALAVPTYIFDPIDSDLKENYWWCINRLRVNTFEQFCKLLLSESKNYIVPKLNYNNKFDDSKDSILLSCQVINKHVSIISKFPEMRYLALIAILVKSPKRVIGNVVRKILMMGQHNVIMSMTKKGLKYEYFKTLRMFK